uniref:Caprin-2 n=1 Tax=Magallana gigas TaxID=29159 RepID=K1R3L5_MAGGI
MTSVTPRGPSMLTLTSIKRISGDQKQEVAFTAAVTSSSTTWNSGTLIFNVVITNAGNGYNPSTGVFTSPIGGTYVFYVSAVEYSKQYLRIDVVLNSVSKVRAIGVDSASYQTGTNMVVLELQKGDSVWDDRIPNAAAKLPHGLVLGRGTQQMDTIRT